MSEVVYVVKYCLSSDGTITRVDADIKEFDGGREYARVGMHGFYRIGREAFREEAEAMVVAKEMRVKKIASLNKQIRKLEMLQFVVKDHTP